VLLLILAVLTFDTAITDRKKNFESVAWQRSQNSFWFERKAL
jgi:hypothetical protein